MTSPLTRVTTVCRVLRFVHISTINDVVKFAHISSTFGDAIESYSATLWRRLTPRVQVNRRLLVALFKHNAFAWITHNMLTIGQLDVSGMMVKKKQHPLLVAAAESADDVVRVCLATMAGCVNVRDKRSGKTALHFVSVCGLTESVRDLLGAGADITIADNKGWTALHYAAEANRVDVVRLLIAHTDFAKIRDARESYGETALHRGSSQCIRELLAAGADVTATDNGGWTALHHAAQHGKLDVIRRLIAHRHFTRIRDARDNYGETALHAACLHGHADCVRALIAAAADVTVVDNRVGWTALHCAVTRGEGNNVDIIRQLVAHADFAKICDKGKSDGETALQYASLCGRTECVRELLAAGADVTVVDNLGKTVLHHAVRHVAVARLLVEHRDFDKIRDVRNSEGETAMDLAKSKEVAQVLSSGVRCVVQ